LAAITILDSEMQEQRPPLTADFVKFVKLVETIRNTGLTILMVCAIV
jgi:hypothetical protein